MLWLVTFQLPSLSMQIYLTFFVFVCEGLNAFAFLQDSSQARLSLAQGNTELVYDLSLTKHASNNSDPTLCGLLDQRIDEFDPSQPVNISLALNGQDFVMHNTTTVIQTEPKKMLVFFESEREGNEIIGGWSYQHRIGK